MRYFIYSQDQYNEKNNILKKQNKKFVAGVVVINGSKKNFTTLSSKPTLERFYDGKIVAQVEDEKVLTYTDPKTIKITDN